MPRKTETGCRPNTLVNVVWAIDAEWLSDARDQIEARMSQASAWETVLKESKDQNEKAVDEQQWELDDKGLAHVWLEGPITKYPTSMSSLFGGTSTVLTQKAVREIEADPRVKAVAMHFDTPGGTAEGVVELAEVFKTLSAKVPTYGIAEGCCSSAGYWLASPLGFLFSEPGTELGSIGGMAVLTDSSANFERQGLKRIVVRSTGAELKGMGVPGTKITPAMEKEIQTRVDAQTAYFLQDVQTGRKLSDEVMNEVRTARVYESKEAKRLGLVDEIAFSSQAVQSIHEDIAKGVVRGRTPPAPQPPAATRSVAMFNAEQLRRIQKLPGGEQATEATAGDLLLSVAETLHTKVQTLPTAPAAPTPPSDDAIAVKSEKIELLVERQNITKAQGDALIARMKAAPIGFFAATDQPGVKVIDTVLSTLQLGKTGANPNPTTVIQPDPAATRTTDTPPGDKTEEQKLAEAGKAQGEAARNAELRAKGIKVE